MQIEITQNNEKDETSHEENQYDGAVSIQNGEYAGREKTEWSGIN